MIFMILMALVIIVTGLFVVREVGDSYGMPIAVGIATLAISACVGALIFLICAINIGPLTNVMVRNDTYQLRALGTSSAIEGRSYFLGGGYVKDKRVLNYITDESGAIRLQQSDADHSTIYEDSAKPTVNVKRYNQVNGWLAPWGFPLRDVYEFHIPAGSVMNDYSVSNQ